MPKRLRGLTSSTPGGAEETPDMEKKKNKKNKRSKQEEHMQQEEEEREVVPLYSRVVADPIGMTDPIIVHVPTTPTTRTSGNSTSTSSTSSSRRRSGEDAHDTMRVHLDSADEDDGEEDEEADEDVKVFRLYGDSYSHNHRPPWLPTTSSSSSSSSSSSASSSLTLGEEVQAFARYMSPTSEERRMRREVIERLKKLIRGIWPRAQVYVFGSSASDLYLPLSDVDLGVVGATGNNPLQILASALRKQGVARYHHVDTIPKARVPIVKLVDAEANCNVDISFASSANGTVNTAIIKRFLNEAEEIRPLALLLKTYLRQLGLSEPYTGGIGSYTLILMIISYLQLHRPDGAEGNDLGELLKGFLTLYGKHFNYSRTGISQERGWLREDRPWLLSIEDAGDVTNDASQSSYGIMEVREAFRRALHALTSTSSHFDSYPTLLSRIILHDARLVQHRLALREHHRKMLASPRHYDGERHGDRKDERHPSSSDRKRSRSERDLHSGRDRDDPPRHHHHHHHHHEKDGRRRPW